MWLIASIYQQGYHNAVVRPVQLKSRSRLALILERNLVNEKSAASAHGECARFFFLFYDVIAVYAVLCASKVALETVTAAER